MLTVQQAVDYKCRHFFRGAVSIRFFSEALIISNWCKRRVRRRKGGGGGGRKWIIGHARLLAEVPSTV